MWQKKKTPSSKDFHAHMRMRQRQLRTICKKSKAENWMAAKLSKTHLNWTRQAQSGSKLMDFWNHRYGLAVEVDGPEHDAEADALSDADLLKRRGIVVLRVSNFSEIEAEAALMAIAISETWNERRMALGLTPVLDQRPRLIKKPA